MEHGPKTTKPGTSDVSSRRKTSSANIAPVPQKAQPQKPQLTDLIAPEREEHTKLAQALSEAQEEITQLKDARHEERIGWIVVVVIVFNCFVLLRADNAGGPIVIGILELAILSVVAARLGVEEFRTLFKNVFERMAGSITDSRD